jgi:hypothetical protein
MNIPSKPNFKSFVRAFNVKSGSTGKSSMGGIEKHAKRLDETSQERRVRQVDPIAWSKVGDGINGGGCDIWDAFKAWKAESGAVERNGASLALHTLVGVSRGWLEEDGRDAHDRYNERISQLVLEARLWAESWAGRGSVSHARFALDAQGAGNVDLVIVPVRMQKRKSGRKKATKEVLTISGRMAKEELRKKHKARTSGQAMQTDWNQWCAKHLDPRIQRGKSKNVTQREHIHADVLREEGDKLRAQQVEAEQSKIRFDEARLLEEEKQTELELLRLLALEDSEDRRRADEALALDLQKQAMVEGHEAGKAKIEELFHWAFELAGSYNGLIMTGLSEIEHCAYQLHQQVVDAFRYNLECEKDRGLTLHQEKFMRAVRSADDFPTESKEAEKLSAQLAAGGFVHTMAKKAGDLMRQFLGRIIEAIGEHSIRYWASKEGESRFDVSKAGLVLGSKAMIELEGQISNAAEDIRECQPVFRQMSANNPLKR